MIFHCEICNIILYPQQITYTLYLTNPKFFMIFHCEICNIILYPQKRKTIAKMIEQLRNFGATEEEINNMVSAMV